MEFAMLAKLISFSLQLYSKVLFLCHFELCMGSLEMFNVLDSVDSTNNYAMAKLQEGTAKHGMAWFAQEQLAGKGQQGKTWETRAGQNIALSIAIQPAKVFHLNQFYFNAALSNTCQRFLTKYAGEEISVKWPNDLYWRDRKAGGILIENKLMGKSWKWAVVGIGINVNQVSFSRRLPNPVSIKKISGRTYDPVALARELHEQIMDGIDRVTEDSFTELLAEYNRNLFQKEKIVRLKKGNASFETQIKGVNKFGQLLTEDAVERSFSFGEVEWIL